MSFPWVKGSQYSDNFRLCVKAGLKCGGAEKAPEILLFGNKYKVKDGALAFR